MRKSLISCPDLNVQGCICYIPDMYATVYNANANWYNVPERVLITIGSSLALVYSIRKNNLPLIINYGPLLFLDATSLSIRTYYAYKNRYRNVIVRENMVTEATIGQPASVPTNNGSNMAMVVVQEDIESGFGNSGGISDF